MILSAIVCGFYLAVRELLVSMTCEDGFSALDLFLCVISNIATALATEPPFSSLSESEAPSASSSMIVGVGSFFES